MADFSIYFAKRRLAVDAIAFTNIVPPIDCRYIGLKNIAEEDLYYRTDPDDPDTEDVVTAGDQDVIVGGYPHGPRFPANQPVAACKLVAGTSDIILTFVR